MTPAPLPPYGEKIVSDYLREHERITAINGLRIVGKTPDDTDAPWVRLTQFDTQSETPHHLLEFYFQVDCYAGKDGGQPEANAVARAVFAALCDLDEANHEAEEAVVTGCDPNMGLRRPDEDFPVPRERFVSTAYVYMHPTGEEGGS